MSDDLLERATAALRESTRTPPEDDVRQRARLLEQAAKQARPTPYWQWAAVALTGVFVSSAMAHFSGYVPELLRALRRDDSPAQASPRGQVARGPTPPAVRPVAPVKVAEPLQPTAADGAPSSAASTPDTTALKSGTPAGVSTPGTIASRSGASSAVSTPGTTASSSRASSADASTPKPRNPSPRAAAVNMPTARARSRASRAPATPSALENVSGADAASEREHSAAASPPPSAADPASVPVPEKAAEAAELALFRRAQALHLSRDPKALAAWDAYLRLASHGVLAPEARYNRALCLVRLGRYDEARAALEAFADGTMHGYRQREAEALLARLPR